MEQELQALWGVVADPSSTADEVWLAWVRIRELMSEAQDA
jgi:hypothetical protein